MSNLKKARPDIRLNLRDETYKLVFDFNALCLLEEETGINALDGDVWRSPTARVLSTVLWAAMQHHHPELSVEQVRRMINFDDIESITKALEQAFSAASSDIEKKKEEGEETTQTAEQPTG